MTKTGLYISRGVVALTMVPLTMVPLTMVLALPVRSEVASGCPEYGPELKDRCWMFGHYTGQFDQPNGFFRIPISPVVTMREACEYMGIPNCCIAIGGFTVPGVPEDEFMNDFRSLKRISLIADNGYSLRHGNDYLDAKLKFGEKWMKRLPNITSYEFDDFFDEDFDKDPPKDFRRERLEDGTEVDVLPGSRTLEKLREIRKRLHSYDHPIDMRIVYYERDLAHVTETKPVVDIFDTVTFWTWFGGNVADLDKNFNSYRRISNKPTILGVYMWDFGNSKPLSADLMRAQLDFALRHFRKGDLDGFIFHCTSLVNKDLPAVEIARQWIIEHGNELHGKGEQKCPPAPAGKPLRPDQRFESFGQMALASEPDSSLLLAGPGRLALVERTGRIAWENKACGNPSDAFYSSGWFYFDDGGVQKRVKYALPCDRTLKPESVDAAKRVTVPKKMKADATLLDLLPSGHGFTSACKLQR